MNPSAFLFNPLQAQAVMLKAMIDASTEMQDMTVAAVKRAGQRKSSPVEWVTFSMPVLDPRSFLDEDVMRQTFHGMADRNLRGWEVAADLLKTLPGWVQTSSKTPGTVMTDWFDQVRRASQQMMPANDAWAIFDGPRGRTGAASAFAPQTAPQPKPTPRAKPAERAVRPAAQAAAAAAMATTTSKRPAAAPSKPAAKPTPARVRTKAPTQYPTRAPTRAKGKPIAKRAPKAAPARPADDLTLIKGIGPKLAARLNAEGIRHYEQIAAWTKAECTKMDEALDLKGRVTRNKWVSQAKALVKKKAA